MVARTPGILSQLIDVAIFSIPFLRGIKVCAMKLQTGTASILWLWKATLICLGLMEPAYSHGKNQIRWQCVRGVPLIQNLYGKSDNNYRNVELEVSLMLQNSRQAALLP